MKKGFVKTFIVSIIMAFVFAFSACNKGPRVHVDSYFVTTGNETITHFVDDEFSLEGYQLTLVMTDGTVKKVELTDDMLKKQPNMSQEGNQNVSFQYNGETYSFSIKVYSAARKQFLQELKDILLGFDSFQDLPKKIVFNGQYGFTASYLGKEISYDSPGGEALTISPNEIILGKYDPNSFNLALKWEGENELASFVYTAFLNNFIANSLTPDNEDILDVDEKLLECDFKKYALSFFIDLAGFEYIPYLMNFVFTEENETYIEGLTYFIASTFAIDIENDEEAYNKVKSFSESLFTKVRNAEFQAIDIKVEISNLSQIIYDYSMSVIFKKVIREAALNSIGYDCSSGGWCSDLYERSILGYNNTKVSVNYDDCNPFGMIAGDFGEITSLSKHTSQNTSDYTINAFNSLSVLFDNFIKNFEIPTNGTEYIPNISDDALNAYTQFYNQAVELYNNSLALFTRDVTNNITKSAVIGLNHPYTMAFGTDVNPQLINFQTVIANLFGFSSKTEFVNYAQNLANTYAEHRADISNSRDTNEALDNGCFYTENGSFVFPIAVKNELTDVVLAYLIIDNNGLVSIWVNDITSALYATSFNSSYYIETTTDNAINNDIYCKNILFVTGPTGEIVTEKVDYKHMISNFVSAFGDIVPVYIEEEDGSLIYDESIKAREFAKNYIKKIGAIIGTLEDYIVGSFEAAANKTEFKTKEMLNYIVGACNDFTSFVLQVKPENNWYTSEIEYMIFSYIDLACDILNIYDENPRVYIVNLIKHFEVVENIVKGFAGEVIPENYTDLIINLIYDIITPNPNYDYERYIESVCEILGITDRDVIDEYIATFAETKTITLLTDYYGQYIEYMKDPNISKAMITEIASQKSISNAEAVDFFDSRIKAFEELYSMVNYLELIPINGFEPIVMISYFSTTLENINKGFIDDKTTQELLQVAMQFLNIEDTIKSNFKKVLATYEEEITKSAKSIICSALGITNEDSVPYKELDTIITHAISNYINGTLDYVTTMNSFFKTVNTYCAEEQKIIANALGMMLSIYFGKDSDVKINYNELFQYIELDLPEEFDGIDYNELVERIWSDSTYDIFTMTQPTIEFITQTVESDETDENGESVKKEIIVGERVYFTLKVDFDIILSSFHSDLNLWFDIPFYNNVDDN